MRDGGQPEGDAPARSEQKQGLRSLSLRGGAYLAVREGSGIVIRLAGVLIVTRMIGPYNFGLYASAAAFAAVLASLAQMGIEVSLISRPEAPSDRTYDSAFTFLVVTSIAAVLVGLAGTVVVQSVTRSPPYLNALRVLLISIPLNICWAPAQARIERQFQYRRMAALELLGDLVLYVTSISLALTGAGFWAPTIGFIVWQGFLFVGSLLVAGRMPRLAWDRHEIRRLLRFGSGYGFTNCLISAGFLVNPLVVGHYLGQTGVGYVALAQRLIGTIGFVNRAVWRLALVALGRVQDDLPRLRRGIEEAMSLQVVLLGPLLVGFTVASSITVSVLFGHRWDPVIRLFAYLGIGTLLGSIFFIPQAVLYAKDKNLAVILKQASYLVVLGIWSAALIPRLGLTGFGVAFIIATIPQCIIHVAAQRIVTYSYGRTLPWLAAFIPPMCFQLAPWPFRLILLAPMGLVFLLPRTRREIAEYVHMAWSSLRPGSEPEPPPSTEPPVPSPLASAGSGGEPGGEQRVANDPTVANAPRVSNDPRVANAPRVSNDPKVTNDPRVINDPKVTNHLQVTDEPRVVGADDGSSARSPFDRTHVR